MAKIITLGKEAREKLLRAQYYAKRKGKGKGK